MAFTEEQIAELKELIRDEIQSNLSLYVSTEYGGGYSNKTWINLGLTYNGSQISYDSFSCSD